MAALHNTLLDSALLLLTGFTALNEENDLLHGDVGVDLLQLLKGEQPASMLASIRMILLNSIKQSLVRHIPLP